MLAVPSFWMGTMVMVYPSMLVGLVAAGAIRSLHRRSRCKTSSR